ncbi:MAG TPA: hypothetical protein VFK78_04145 [Gemmatimonadales bacterium]|nr:hypothetical protein [Gemmatimonadales bacterium]
MRPLALGLALALPAPALCQAGAGAELWRLAGTTLAVPAALATGSAAAFWNPAQSAGAFRGAVAVDAIETAAEVGASGVLFGARLATGRLGAIGLVGGEMSIGDLVTTSTSPTPDPGSIPFYALAVGATWARRFGGADLGATLALQDTRLDVNRSARATFDVGVSREFGRVRVAAATHFLSRLALNDPSQDLFAGVEYRFWEGTLWGVPQSVVRVRYGATLAHGYGADHAGGAGLDLGGRFSADALILYEGGYATGGFRAVGAVGVTIGRYRLALARDSGSNDVGGSFRVGLEARFQ